MPRFLIPVAILLCFSKSLFAADAAEHGDPSAIVVLYLAIILVVAKLGGELAERIGQPAVLGELVAGIALGNVALSGFTWFDGIKSDAIIDMFARIGAIILLFEVGLESTVEQMRRVGFSSLLVASAGVSASFALGWAIAAWMLPGQSGYAHAFLGAALCATSVGITARVLKDLGRSQSVEARIILGAAVIDDVMGLVVLAVATGIITAAARPGAAAVSYAEIGIIVGKAIAFLVGALLIGAFILPHYFHAAAKLRARGVLLAAGLSFCFLLAWLSNLIGLAPIIGAFAAGLMLEEFHFAEFTERGEQSLGELIQPISALLVPVFFVLMGMQTDLRSFAHPGVLGLAAALTAAAVLGKQVCGLAVLNHGVDRLAVGIGMIPRGEVVLIFANTGLSLTIAGQPVIDKPVYSALVIMVVFTTMITPVLLKWRFCRLPTKKAEGGKQ